MISSVFIMLTMIAATMVITSMHPVHSMVWLVLCFMSSAVVFLQLHAHFMAVMTLIVYVGAMAMLFIFVLMMLNLSSAEMDYNTIAILPMAMVTMTSMMTVMLNLKPSNGMFESMDHLSMSNLSNLQTLGGELYTFYASYFMLISMMLLVAMIGSITLTLNSTPLIKRQNLFLQMQRDFYSLPKNSDTTNN